MTSQERNKKDFFKRVTKLGGVRHEVDEFNVNAFLVEIEGCKVIISDHHFKEDIASIYGNCKIINLKNNKIFIAMNELLTDTEFLSSIIKHELK